MKTLPWITSVMSISIIALLVALTTLSAEAALFNNSIEETYTFNRDGVAHVTKRFTLHAQQEHLLSDTFHFSLDSETAHSLRVYYAGAELSFEQHEDDVTVFMPERFGLEDDTTVEVKYFQNDLSQIEGDVTTLFLPLLASSEDISIDSYVIQVIAPNDWGDVSMSSSSMTNRERNSIEQILEFDLPPDSYGAPLRISFGTAQLYDVELHYELQNTTDNVQYQEIAFPPSTAMQKVYMTAIEPKPNEVEIDSDGNVLGIYKLYRGQVLPIVFKGQVYVSQLRLDSVVPELPEQAPAYLMPDNYWETTDPEIQRLAGELQTPRAIYDYVVDRLSYDHVRVASGALDRKGAVWALSNPENAACMEFTDLTISLLRAAGIPAREVNGYAYQSKTQPEISALGSDVLHSWVQYWDSTQGWIDIDPTWGASTGEEYFDVLDLQHITFVVKGVTSERPFPAGSYRSDGYVDQQINVSIAQDKVEDTPIIEDWVTVFNDEKEVWWRQLLELFFS